MSFLTSWLDNPDRKWCIRDMFVDHQTGRLRETAVWSSVCKICMTWAFVYSVLHEHFNELLWVAYGSIMLGHEAYARYMNQRQHQMDKEPVK